MTLSISIIYLGLMAFFSPSSYRLSIWLGSRLRRDVDTISVEKRAEAEHLVRPEDIRDALLPHSR